MMAKQTIAVDGVDYEGETTDTPGTPSGTTTIVHRVGPPRERVGELHWLNVWTALDHVWSWKSGAAPTPEYHEPLPWAPEYGFEYDRFFRTPMLIGLGTQHVSRLPRLNFLLQKMES